MIVPQADLTGASGEALLSLSRFQFGGGARLSGNFATGGRDLPRIEGRIEQDGSAGFTAHMAMATYQADGGSVAVPSLAVVSRGDRIGFAGAAIVSGDLPGGHAEGLLLPLSGNWSSAVGLALWRGRSAHHQPCAPRMTHMSKAHSAANVELTACKYSLISTRLSQFSCRDVAFHIKRFAFRA